MYLAGLKTALMRLLAAVPIVLAVTFLTFLMLYSIGDPASVVAGESASPEQVEQVREDLGFDRPLLAQYGSWLAQAVQGDMGSSLHHKGPVASLLAQSMPPTLMLAGLAMTIAVAVTLLVGTMFGLRPGGLFDRLLRGFSLLGLAIPNFLVGLLLILVFAIWLGWLPSGGYRTVAEVGPAGTLRYLVLPAVSLALGLMCLQVRTFRASLVSEYQADYVRTAQMKGASRSATFFSHVARNAAGPWVTVIGLEVGILITGALLVESVFAIPGVGTLTLESVRGQDFPVVQGLVAVFAVVVISANLVADLVVMALNPAARARA